jgi:hypothetical protein
VPTLGEGRLLFQIGVQFVTPTQYEENESVENKETSYIQYLPETSYSGRSRRDVEQAYFSHDPEDVFLIDIHCSRDEIVDILYELLNQME